MKKDVIIIGAGASGLMCAIEAAKRKKNVLVIDHANKVGKKILMSGGGRCNFTNYYVAFDRFYACNPHFYKSALSRYTQWDFITLVEKYQLAYHEKTLGQLFCDHKSKEIVDILLAECKTYGVEIKLNTKVEKVVKEAEGGFFLKTSQADYYTTSLVIATGGLSIPSMGASGFGYQIAKQFGLKVTATRAGLVPFVLSNQDKERFQHLSGISAQAIVSCNWVSFQENILFTHRGISGPAILQISSFWMPGDTIEIKLLPDICLDEILIEKRNAGITCKLKTYLEQFLAKRLIAVLIDENLLDMQIAALSDKQIQHIKAKLQHWQLKPCTTEGYRTAEVTIGGVDCNEISSKTFCAHKVPGLYFIGEVLDVHGWLGGYNFQWAWSSGFAAGQVVE
ncbi:BaiN/RdsA family NAD(P)/FAD-dependent oxidoreductase [Facilibium subflavum]|uniref:NAD(P)/FAD-dependent oxidoreductase n=1 Tax=Facilibium subflavum TaxID=2219058 RepID=UPI000E659796|nr:NAD(P)/FAD-dependent oxidoreductase [Facilibium subflavum]